MNKILFIVGIVLVIGQLYLMSTKRLFNYKDLLIAVIIYMSSVAILLFFIWGLFVV